MKFDKTKAFPYPVLRPYSDDYLNVEFQATVDFSINEKKIKVSVGFALSSNEILNEIENGAAEYVAVVSCRDTYVQRVIKSREKNVAVEFNSGDLRGEVCVSPYIIVVQNISSFKSPDINPEFGEGPFEFVPGDVLAQDDAQAFYFDRDMFKSVTSVFDLVKKDDLSDGVWTVSFDENHVQIAVSPNMKASIDEARNDSKKRCVLVNSIYFAAAMQAIIALQKGKEIYEDKKWAQVLFRQAHNKGIDIENDDVYLVVERLMQEPLKRLNEFVLKGSI